MTDFRIIGVDRSPDHGHLTGLKVLHPRSPEPLAINMAAAYNTLLAGDWFVFTDPAGQERSAVGGVCTKCGKWTLRCTIDEYFYDNLDVPDLSFELPDGDQRGDGPEPPTSQPTYTPPPTLYELREELSPPKSRPRFWGWMGR